MMRKLFIITITLAALFPLNSVAQIEDPDPAVYTAPIYTIPKTFSPNNEATANDVFMVFGNVQAVDLKIYNRWGNEVAVLSKPDDRWDGKSKDQAQPAGEYFYAGYVVTIDGVRHDVQGNVELIR